MKIKLNKKKIKSLSDDKKTIPAEMTPQVAGGNGDEFTFAIGNGRQFTCGPCKLH